MILIDIPVILLTLYVFLSSLDYFTSAFIFLIYNKKITRENIYEVGRVGGNRYLMLIPSHNEEKVIARLLDSIANLNYPNDMITPCVICDNCSDNTEEIAKQSGSMIVRRLDENKKGKGYAVEWALSQIDIERFDIIIMTDADTMLDKDILIKLDMVFSDETTQVVQCYNGVINPDDTPLTRLTSLARAMEIIYMASRSYLGLSVHLIGNGMCFRPQILKKFPWQAFSLSEDLEYFCMLAVNGIRIRYSFQAKVLLQEERTFSHAKTQRQRWSSGRFPLIRKYVQLILWNGIKNRSLWQTEAASLLLIPNPSMLGNLLIMAIVLNLMVTLGSSSGYMLLASIVFMSLYFASAFMLVKMRKKEILSLFLVPVYLCWKGMIDIRSLIRGRRDQWIKTQRH